MKIITRAVWDIESGVLLEEESFEHAGPMALCDRSQSKQVANQGMAQSAQNAQQGATAFGAANNSISDLQKQVKTFQASNPFKIGGEWDTSQRTINADTSNAGTNALQQQMALNAQRTGLNAASYAPSLAEAQRSAARDQAAAEAKAEQQRIGSEAAYNAEGVQMGTLAPDLQARLYGTATGGASGNLNPAASAAKTPGFMDTLIPSLIQGGATVGAAALKSS